MKYIFRLNEFTSYRARLRQARSVRGKKLQIAHPIITWGVFDGVHRGHQKIIRALTQQARRNKDKSIVLTFDIHPDRVLGKSYHGYITSLKYRLNLFRQLGVDIILVCPFTKQFSQLGPEDFIKDILVKKLKIEGIVAGHDTRFGKNLTGDIGLLKRLCKKYCLELTVITPLKYRGKVVSSTRIRKNIRQGKLGEAEAMLGRPVTLLGTVVRGAGRGKQLGFPTVNLKLHHELIPPQGVYASQVRLNKKTYRALTNIGQRPTFISGTHSIHNKAIVESHLIGFRDGKNNNLYGSELEVQLISKIRNEHKFESPAELIKQIEQDREYLLTKTNQ